MKSRRVPLCLSLALLLGLIGQSAASAERVKVLTTGAAMVGDALMSCIAGGDVTGGQSRRAALSTSTLAFARPSPVEILRSLIASIFRPLLIASTTSGGKSLSVMMVSFFIRNITDSLFAPVQFARTDNTFR